MARAASQEETAIKPASVDPARTRENADLQVRECLELMASGRWIIGHSHLDMAERYQVHPKTASAWATAASRILRFAIEGDVETLRATMMATLGRITQQCMASGEPRTAVAAIETQAKLLGLMVQKHEVQCTPEEVDKLLADAAALHGAK